MSSSTSRQTLRPMPPESDVHSCDVLIIGSGAAGLSAALALADRYDVTVLSKSKVSAGSTAWAQGGIAAVLEDGDTFESHIADTMDAGAGLCRREAVEFVVERAPAAVDRLVQLGVRFNPGDDALHPFHLTREGGHSHRRIVHVDDATGWAVQKMLEEAAEAHPRITLIEQHVGVDLITQKHVGGPAKCHGLYVLDRKSKHVRRFLARATILATGGASRVYLYSTNPDGSTGDGIAMAWRAGCRVANMEFNQFHPTCLYHPRVKNFLITEAMRGEGAHLLLPDTALKVAGSRFMDRFDKRGELAPRDIVARAIDHEMKRLGVAHVDLDISHKDPDFIIGHFPTIYRRTLELGFDITKGPIPVVPAAHYTCGGVLTGLDGTTDLAGLYAIGETAHTGLHGANRMASNSLLECLVFGEAAANHIDSQMSSWTIEDSAPRWDESRVRDSDEEIVITHNWAELRQFMWDYVGIVRTNKRLERAQHRVALLMQEVHDFYGNFRVSRDLLELRNLVTVADLIVRCAQARHESRGLHYSTDYPDLLPEAVETILTPTP
jgi:L-aspartate oxidase